MEKQEHTPGPWRISPSGGLIQQLDGGPLNCICRGFGRDEEPFPNWEANSRLIAAAPELLAALTLVLSSWEIGYKAACHSVDVHNNSDGVGIDYDYGSYPAVPEWVTKARAAIAKATGQTETHDEQEP